VIRSVSILLAFLSLHASAPAADTWHTDLETARKEAFKDRKDILIEFAGSDWSPACIALRKQVLDTEGFSRFARRFVLVKIDFPRKTKLSEEAIVRNKAAAAAFAVTSYPTVVMVDGKTSEEFGRVTGYGGKDAQAYVAELSAFRNTPEDRAQRKEEEREQAAELEGIRTNEKMIQAAIKARDFPAAVAVIDVIYKGVKPPQLALGTLNKAILSHRIDPKAMDRTWKLLQQALLEAEGEADLSKAVLEMARRISPARKLEKAKPEPKAKADKGA
jgi:thioredoxin-related protein